ncbi:MAG: 4'-phosphopantetheinyl transferase superfamily protein [Clostridia bacterium]|nr:4'-phosphopantetheinyl transferase superfamily protein [Clostridia bacterium]
MFEVAYKSADEVDIYDDIIINSLSQYRINKLKSLKIENAKRETVAAEILLIQLLTRHSYEVTLPLKIEVNEKGKPYLANMHGVYFNLSHSNGMVCCAIANNEVGVDIQHMGEYKKEIANRFFTADEQEYIKGSANEKNAFYEIWAKKEALLKCKGTGLGTMSCESVFDAQNNGYSFKCSQKGEYMICACIKNI